MGNEYQINKEQLGLLNQLVNKLSANQLIWVNGYITGVLTGKQNSNSNPVSAQSITSEPISILYGTHTGHSKTIAQDLYDRVNDLGFDVKLQGLDKYKKNQLKKEKYVFLIVSTHGEGEPPMQAEDIHEFVQGDRVPKLKDLKYAVLALGDKSYKQYCKTGIDFDLALAKFEGKALLPIKKCDVSYDEDAQEWIESVVEVLSRIKNNSVVKPVGLSTPSLKKRFNRINPFYGEVLEKQRITTTNSEKEIYHFEISLEDSGISYQAGDSLGVLPNNPKQLVELLIEKLHDDAERIIRVGTEDLSLITALQNKFEITVLNQDLLQKYNVFVKNASLEILLNEEEKLDHYLYGADLYDLLNDYPGEISTDQLLGILRVLNARVYSISSGPALNPEEVHITTASVRYQHKNRKREGACSTYLIDQVQVGDKVPIYIENNDAFRLPEDIEKPVIMVGAGTGVAPYRSFIQELEQKNKKGDSWLFFGNQRFREDFLYQTEWQDYVSKGVLEKIDLAFSRDQKEKDYVQHRLKENSSEVYKWLENGAHFYICGDRKHMAKDVQKTLLEIIQFEGGVTLDKAEQYLKNLKREHRLLLDVY